MKATILPRFRLLAPLFLALGAIPVLQAAAPSTVKLTRLDDRVRFEIDGKLFTEYIFSGTPRPYFYPILAPDGTQLNRDFPMANRPDEEQDHPHHRSLWFTHGSVNGEDFWAELPKSGKLIHDGLIETTSGGTGVLRAKRRWVSVEGKQICRDEIRVSVRAVPGGRLVDHEVTIYAPADSAVTFGDTKEGSMAIRLAQWMTLTHKVKGKEVPGSGTLVTSTGKRNGDVWGTRAPWADYFAPHNGKVYGVAIFDHPKNPRYPTWWHARDYGLFAANPFGRHDFENLKDQPKAGDLVIPAGGSVTFRHGIYIHEGDTDAAKVAERFREFSEGR